MVNAVQEGPPFCGDRWDPPLDAIEYTSFGDGVDEPILRVFTHPDAPYFQTVPYDQTEPKNPPEWLDFLKVAFSYVMRVTRADAHPRFELEPGWVEALDPDTQDPHFGWMGLRGLDEKNKVHLPLGSLDGTVKGDHLIVLFASERLGTSEFRGSEFGVRVALRWRTDAYGNEFSIIGISAVLPFGIYRKPMNRLHVSDDFLLSAEESESGLTLGMQITNGMVALAGLDTEKHLPSLRGVRLARLDSGEIQVEAHAVGFKTGLDGAVIPYAVSTLNSADRKNKVTVVGLMSRNEFFADADGDARVFKKVPPPERIYRVRRDEDALDGQREWETIDKNNADPALAYKANLQVIPCPRFVRADAGATAPLHVPLPAGYPPKVRTNAASAVQGLRFGRDFLIRMEAYGLAPTDYFKLINKRIDIAYRSFVSPGPGKDGQSVNARVLPYGWPPTMIGPVVPGTLPVVQVHLSLADCARRERKHWTPGGPRQPAIPMGIAADERWLWHEFGHILTLASTGELELRFAHSPGDALAAIVGDPELDPELDDPRTAKYQWRGATFPWVYLPRRHDRCVRGGWSWCGSMHKSLAQVPATEHPRRKGYLSEQILSSTLFRIYRCIGGDTLDKGILGKPDQVARRRASHYTSFLIMQGVRLLGDAKVVPAMDPIQIEHTLKEADLLQIEWVAPYLPFGEDPSETQTYTRVGGCTTKVIRWAFEAQGLHAPPNSGYDYNEIGVPRPVDIYIKSRRPTKDPGFQSPVDFGFGSYVPVSLHWQQPVDEVPQWQADPDGGIVWREVDQEIDVWVGNRGTADKAIDVTVSVWFAEWPTAQPEPPDWEVGSGVWMPCPPAVPPLNDIAKQASERFGPFDFNPDPARRYVVVAIADCPSDTALVHRFNHACYFLPTPLIDIVPNDNNMGLLVIPSK